VGANYTVRYTLRYTRYTLYTLTVLNVSIYVSIVNLYPFLFLFFITVASNGEVYPVSLTLQLSNSSLIKSRCTSVLWSPPDSMSITQRQYPPNTKSTYHTYERHAAKPPRRSSSAPSQRTTIPPIPNFTSTPNLHIQVFDAAKKRAEALPHIGAIGVEGRLEKMKLAPMHRVRMNRAASASGERRRPTSGRRPTSAKYCK
jgi:hypothetical protein